MGCCCLVCEAGLGSGSFIHHAVGAVLLGGSPGVPRLRKAFPWLMSIDALFKALLQVSLNRSLGQPLDLGPPEGSPYSKSLGM